MSLKNKLRAGICFLFLLALLCSGLAAYYLQRLSSESNAILKDNYRSITYTQNIGNLLDAPLTAANLSAIQANLTAQKQNVTEIGERQLTRSLQNLFNSYQKAGGNPALLGQLSFKMRATIDAIVRINMKSIEFKGQIANNTAKHGLIIIALMGSFCFLIGFSFLVNFPDYIATPVTKLAEGLEQVTIKNEAKTNLIATISHELKTPISSIKMSLKLLEDSRVGQVNTEQRQLIENITDDTQRLLQITGELLNMAQVETGKIQLNFGSAHPKDIVDYAVKALKFIADQRRVSIKVYYDDNLPNVRADLDKTTWVLINLLSNAIKYSSENAFIELSVKKIRSNSIEFSVKDYGKGIEPQYLDRVFERYFKIPGINSGQPGTGLGLAIAKDFIEAQAGKIGVESQLNQGSRFYFWLAVG
ncbi:phospho-acceptor domain-containing protein [Mucilaginibacter gracilis]|uniref:histidine kinase n=1 Tax=Mucilaginibacter gracilis TaxID=423350 RepID=A0A495IU77_9SPHI|nr:HAMP domain-containing sensor histidine kinase [Mucilaginibacter gracilis]RKR80306.1 phospho-acceptor domain-containing protein [Mucilaginibacter gracilis]